MNNNIKSVNGYKCIGPCFPPNTIYYNPASLVAIKSKDITCPVREKINLNGNYKYMYADQCESKNIFKDYMDYDIFDDYFQIVSSSNDFLKQIYKLNNIIDIIHFISDSIDVLPIYSQKRLIKAIYEVYYKFIEFPKKIFSDKIHKILNKIYQINKIITPNDILNELNNLKLIKSDEQDIFNYLSQKFSK